MIRNIEWKNKYIYELNEYQIRRRSTFSMQFWFHLKMNQSFQILCILVRIYAFVIIIRVPGLHCSKLDTDCIETLEYRVAAMVFCLRTCKIYWGMQIVLYKWSFCWWYQGFSFKSILKYFPNECRILISKLSNKLYEISNYTPQLSVYRYTNAYYNCIH